MLRGSLHSGLSQSPFRCLKSKRPQVYSSRSSELYAGHVVARCPHTDHLLPSPFSILLVLSAALSPM